MADLMHLSNLVQGEVIRIRERRPLEDQPELLQELIDYLSGEIASISITRLKVAEELSEA
jgi:hypothetical protein